MKKALIQGCVALAALAGVVAEAGRAQTEKQDYTLNVNGQSGTAKVVQINGHSYVDLDALARIANGSVAYQGNQIALNLPGAGGAGGSSAAASSAPSNLPSNPPPNNGFSKAFVRAGIEFMSQIREWRNTLLTAVGNGYPLSDGLFAGYRGQAATNLRMAKVAANTEGDRNAADLLANEYDNMEQLTKKYLDKRANLEFIDPKSLDTDAGNQKILTCARSLAAMASNNQFVDDGSCH
ncbi:MAG TPA: hypothetical protein VL128_04030 [Candidatus Eisenbacteria bacterium]|nr:hypothetical protein [Candidatus Eisenbacteria bacterium]